jgi:DNA-binding transcriptional ArsR family regulator
LSYISGRIDAVNYYPDFGTFVWGFLDMRKPFGYGIGNRMVANSRKQRDSVFKAVADPTRREILGILRGGQHTVGAIAENFRMSRPAVSKHLRLLRSAGLVVTRKHGAASLCALNPGPLLVIEDWLQDYETFWGDTLHSLKRHMEEKQ